MTSTTEQRIEEVLADWIPRVEQSARDRVRFWHPGSLPDSPIEALMLIALTSEIAVRAVHGSVGRLVQDYMPLAPGSSRILTDEDVAYIIDGERLPVVALFSDHSIGDYRADFVLCLLVAGARCKPLVIECDGHEYHERTKEQAAHDRERDRWMLSAGLDVMRFTGSQIWRDPYACAVEAIDHLLSPMWSVVPAADLAARLDGQAQEATP